MRRLILAVALLLTLLSAALAQPARPPAASPVAINTYCWNGTAVAMCGSAGTAGSGTVAITSALPAGTNLLGSVNTPTAGTITNPSNTITRPANTTNYAQNNLIASSVTAGSVVVPSFSVASNGGAIPRVRLSTNKTSGWDAVVIRVRLWSSAPTYTNGDGGAYAIATGAAGLLAVFDVTLSQFGDGATGMAAPNSGTAAWIKVSGTSVFWDLQYTSAAALTPASGQTLTLVVELAN